MKFQPKRFVVEVKRGTSRAAFSSPDAAPDKFSSAEASLFGGAPKSEVATSRPKARIFAEPPRRILESLIEAPAAPVAAEEPAEPVRRGRKPGSKNKPKPVAPTIRTDAAPPLRALSPEAQAFLAAPPAPPAEALRAEGPAAPGTEQRDLAAEPGEGLRPERRPRLRERSTILKRYVLGTEKKLGQAGSLRARRKARAAL